MHWKWKCTGNERSLNFLPWKTTRWCMNEMMHDHDIVFLVFLGFVQSSNAQKCPKITWRLAHVCWVDCLDGSWWFSLSFSLRQSQDFIIYFLLFFRPSSIPRIAGKQLLIFYYDAAPFSSFDWKNLLRAPVPPCRFHAAARKLGLWRHVT